MQIFVKYYAWNTYESKYKKHKPQNENKYAEWNRKEGVVEFQFTTYVGGQVVQPEAFALLEIKA